MTERSEAMAVDVVFQALLILLVLLIQLRLCYVYLYIISMY